MRCVDNWLKSFARPSFELRVCPRPKLSVLIGREIPDGAIRFRLPYVDAR
jgi:hypothetical protein